MGICGEQCPKASELLARGYEAEDINDRMKQATDGREPLCRTDGPTGQYNRCGLQPSDRHVLQAIASCTLKPLLALEQVQIEV